MPDSSPARRRRRDLVHRLRSVRVRITVAAVLVTAVAIGTAGGLLVRSVEDSQIRQVREDIDNDLDQVAAGLEDGMPLEDIGSVPASSSLAFLQVTDGRSMVATFAAGPEGTFLSTEAPGAEGALVPPWPPMAGEVGGETRSTQEVRSERRASEEARNRPCASGEANGGACGTHEAGGKPPGASAGPRAPTRPPAEGGERRG